MRAAEKAEYTSETGLLAFGRTPFDLAPLSTRNWTTLSYPDALAPSSAMLPSVLTALTSQPSSTASLTASSVRASTSRRAGLTHADPPPLPVAALSAVVGSRRGWQP